MRIPLAVFAVAAAVLAPATSSAQSFDRWGLTREDWLILPGPEFRAKVHAAERRAEIESLAAAGDAEASTIASGAWTDNTWGQPDPVAAVRYARVGSDAGIPRAMTVLANQLAAGNGAGQDIPAALALYRRAADFGQVQAMVGLVRLYMTKSAVPRDSGEPRRLLERAIGLGNDDALVSLGVMYQQGELIPADNSRAVQLFAQAVDHGNVVGMQSLAFMIENGLGTPKSPERAAALYARAAQSGLALSQYRLAMMKREGAGIPRDLVGARDLLRQAAEQGFDDARLQYGIMIVRGEGGPANPAIGYGWVKRAAEGGYVEAMLYWAYRLRDPDGENDPAAAVAWLRRAADAGNVEAMGMAGVILVEGGRNLPADRAAAVAMWKRAAALGYAPAMYWLAEQAVRDRNEADLRFWANRAAAAGYAPAKEMVQKIAAYDREQSERETAGRAPSNSRASIGGAPSPFDIVRLSSRLNARHMGWEVAPDEQTLVVRSVFGGELYRFHRSLSGLNCQKLSATSFRCSYDLTIRQVKGEDNSWSALAGAFQVTIANAIGTDVQRGHHTNDFALVRGDWTSATLDADVRQYALAARERARRGGNPGASGTNSMDELNREIEQQRSNTATEWMLMQLD